MRIDLLYPELPPASDAIGEHNRELALELARRGVRVRLIHASKSEPEAISDVELVRLPGRMPHALRGLRACLAQQKPDWLITAYNPFSYGRWGVNPLLPWTLGRVRRELDVALALFVHEPFVPARTPKLGLMTAVQRLQLWATGRAHEVIAFSTDEWARRFASWWPKSAVTGLPIGSNLPLATVSRSQARAVLGLDENCTVLAMFSGVSSDRDQAMVLAALEHLGAGDTFLHVGSQGAGLAAILEQAPVRCLTTGRVDRQQAANALAAADVALCPFADGVSPRRGSFLAILQQGVPTVTTSGPLTGDALVEAAEEGAFLLRTPSHRDVGNAVADLLADPELRRTTGARGQAYYLASHAWPAVVDAYQQALSLGSLRPRPLHDERV